MTYQTHRLSLEPVKESDLADIHKLLSIKEVDQYNVLGIPTNIEVTTVYLDEWMYNFRMRSEYVFSIYSLEDHTFIGLISLRKGNAKYNVGMIWYKLLPVFWGQGYATEATLEILRIGFEKLNLHRIEAGCAVDNIGSIRVLEKIGMHKEGQKRKVLPLESGWSDTYEYAILDQDWQNS